MKSLAFALVLAAIPTMAQTPPADLVVRHETIVDVTNGQTQSKYETWQTPTLVELRSVAQEAPGDERRAEQSAGQPAERQNQFVVEDLGPRL